MLGSSQELAIPQWSPGNFEAHTTLALRYMVDGYATAIGEHAPHSTVDG
jgi:hypothetical protein